jgi:hypothetical protein
LQTLGSPLLMLKNLPDHCSTCRLRSLTYLLPPFQNKSYVWTWIALRNKSYVWWNFSQTLPNELYCFQKQYKCCCWWTTKSNNTLHLFNNRYLDSTVSMHINAVLCSSVSSAQNGGLAVQLAPKVFDFTIDTPSSPESTSWELCNAHHSVLKVRKTILISPWILQNITFLLKQREYLFIHSPHLLVRATSERFLPAWGTFKASLASESHW